MEAPYPAVSGYLTLGTVRASPALTAALHRLVHPLALDLWRPGGKAHGGRHWILALSSVHHVVVVFWSTTVHRPPPLAHSFFLQKSILKNTVKETKTTRTQHLFQSVLLSLEPL